MSALPPDYDADPGRWGSWQPPQDVFEIVASEVRGPMLDAGCGEGRLKSQRDVFDRNLMWVGVDASPAQVANNPYRPIVLADMSPTSLGPCSRTRNRSGGTQSSFPLETRDEVRAFCRHHSVPAERAEVVELPLWLTKRGVLIHATKA